MLKITDHLQTNKLLEYLLNQLIENYKIKPCFGVEIEFYLSDNINITVLESQLSTQIKKEKGLRQFEIDLLPTTRLLHLAEQIHFTKNVIAYMAKQLNGTADFSGKPFLNDYGNSMHFHLSFIKCANVKSSASYVEDKQFLHHAAKSLCHFMLEHCIIFAPESNDYLRLEPQFMAPTHVSYGYNNRTVAIRIPDSAPKRLEHRLATPTADPYAVMCAILQAILYGLQYPNTITNIAPIYGNAFDPQYALQPLPRSLKEATHFFKKSTLYKDYYNHN